MNVEKWHHTSDEAQTVAIGMDRTAAGHKKSNLVTRNVVICGNRTSLRLEQKFWDALAVITEREEMKRNDLLSIIKNQKKDNASVTSAVRTFIFNYFFQAQTEEGHTANLHGRLKFDPQAQAHAFE